MRVTQVTIKRKGEKLCEFFFFHVQYYVVSISNRQQRVFRSCAIFVFLSFYVLSLVRVRRLIFSLFHFGSNFFHFSSASKLQLQTFFQVAFNSFFSTRCGVPLWDWYQPLLSFFILFTNSFLWVPFSHFCFNFFHFTFCFSYSEYHTMRCWTTQYK